MRTRNIFWGLLILIIGIVLLMNQLIPGLELYKYLGGIVLVLIGVWLLLRYFIFQGKNTEEQVQVPLENAREAIITLHHGAGRLLVGAGAKPEILLNGEIVGSFQKEVSRSGEKAFVELKMSEEAWFGSRFHEGLDWNLVLNEEIPLSLQIKGGASEIRLNLTNLKVNDLDLQTGANSTVIRLPENAGHTRVRVSTGVSSLKINVPEGVGARIATQGGITSIHVDSRKFPKRGNIYESVDFDKYANKIDMKLESGVGSVEVY